MSHRLSGTVKWLNVETGYGSIVPNAAAADVFVLPEGIDREGFLRLNEGQRGEFNVIDSDRGLICQKVTPLS